MLMLIHLNQSNQLKEKDNNCLENHLVMSNQSSADTSDPLC